MSNKLKIVVLDGYTTNPGDNPWDGLEELGELEVYDRTPRDKIVERAAGADVVLTNKTPLEAETIERLESLRFIAVLATGYDVVDLEAAREHDIPVSNVPEYSTDSVVEHTFALLLELTHHVGMHDAAVKSGEWEESPDFSFWKRPLTELHGKTLGVVGFGRIGSRVAQVASAFGMRVLAHTRTPKPAPEFGPFEWVERDELFERSDVVSLHCPLTEQTEGMVDASRLSRMKESAYLINTGRGDLVVESDLKKALDEGEIAGAAVDVASSEPIESDNPLLEADDCIITPHIAWTSLEARQRLMQTTVENVEAFLRGRPQHVVNGSADDVSEGAESEAVAT